VPATGLRDAVLELPRVFSDEERHIPLPVQHEGRLKRFAQPFKGIDRPVA
jgi:hypothetical protein